MVFNATYTYISVIWWRSVLLVKETGVPVENHRPSARLLNYLASYACSNNVSETFKLFGFF